MGSFFSLKGGCKNIQKSIELAHRFNYLRGSSSVEILINTAGCPVDDAPQPYFFIFSVEEYWLLFIPTDTKHITADNEGDLVRRLRIN